jgi:hypothetical protein
MPTPPPATLLSPLNISQNTFRVLSLLMIGVMVVVVIYFEWFSFIHDKDAPSDVSPWHDVATHGGASSTSTLDSNENNNNNNNNNRHVINEHTGTTTEVEEDSSSSLLSLSRVCLQNPYLLALVDDAETITSRMDHCSSKEYKTEMYHQAMTNETWLVQWNRFTPLTPLTSCQPQYVQCLGGACRSDESKISCGVVNHQPPVTTTKQSLSSVSSSSSVLPVLPPLPSSSSSSSSSTMSQNCIIYSIGGNNQWAFEIDVLMRTTCDVHTFDCTGDISRFTQIPSTPRLHFHHVCLGTQHEAGVLLSTSSSSSSSCQGYQKCGETWTLAEIQTNLGHGHIDLLKVDIEGFEWPLLESWVDLAWNDTNFVLPYQIMMEVHYRTQFSVLWPEGVVSSSQDFKSPVQVVKLFESLLYMGYVVIERDDNQWCGHCTEITIVRIRCPNKQ